MKGQSILVIDPNPSRAEPVREALIELGFKVVGIASTAEQAIERFAVKPPDLVLMDVRLQQDFEPLQANVTSEKLYGVPVIYLIDGDQEHLPEGAITSPFSVLPKSIERQELYAAIVLALHKHRAEHSLAESEEWYRELFDNASDIQFLVADDGSAKSVNRQGAEALGYSSDKLTGRSIWTLIHPQDKPGFQALAADVFNGRRTDTEMEFRLLRADGSVLWVDGKSRQIQRKRGERILHLTCRDATERRYVQEVQYAHWHYLESMQRVTDAVAKSLDPEALIPNVLEAIRQTFDADRVWLAGYGEPTETCWQLAAEAAAPEYLGSIELASPVPLDPYAERIFTEALATTGFLVYPPMAEESPWAIRSSIRSQMVLALTPRFGQRRLLSVQDCRSRRLWTGEQGRLLTDIAGRVEDLLDTTYLQRKLKESEEKVRLLLNSASEGIYGLDLEAKCTLANPACVELLGFQDEEELVGKRLHEIIHHSYPDGRPYPETSCLACEAFRQGRRVYSDDEVFFRADGTSFPVEYRSNPVYRDGRIVGAVVTFSDISERLRAQQQLAFLAEHDNLTELPNRALFLDRLHSGISRAKRSGSALGLLYLDLDDFKPVNDQHGHHVGDLLLRSVAKRLPAMLREVDTVARLGGDEFAIILEDLPGRSDAESVAAKITHSLSRPFHIEGQEIVVGASIGVAIYPEDGSDADTLLRQGDAAMYLAKKR